MRLQKKWLCLLITAALLIGCAAGDALGYEVVKLDRVVFAGLTKKDLRRGYWRFLTKKEVSFLKMISSKSKEEEK